MNRFLPEIIHCFVLFGLGIQFFVHSNQKNFRTDSFGLGIFTFIIVLFFKRHEIRGNYRYLLNFFVTLILACFVFFKLVEYDPIQILPQKMAIKIAALFWVIVLALAYHKLSKETYSILGPILAVLPVFSFTDFMAYPIFPISIALALSFFNSKLFEPFLSKKIVLVLLALLTLLVRDWSDDHAFVRIVILIDGLLFFVLLVSWQKSLRVLLLKYHMLVFLVGAIGLVIKLLTDTGFKWNAYHEEVFLIPVSLLASHSFLIASSSVILLIDSRNWKDKIFLYIVVSISVFFLVITVSRNSIVSFFAFIIIYLLLSNIKKFNFKSSFFILSTVAVALLFLLQSEKSLSDLSTSSVRMSIWSFYFFSTIINKPLFGYGFYPENKIPFFSADFLPESNFAMIHGYLDTFQGYPLAHNLYFQLFSSIGILGSFLFLFSVVFIIIKYKNVIIDTTKENKYIIVLFSVWLFHEFFDFNTLELCNFFLLVSLFTFLFPSSYRFLFLPNRNLVLKKLVFFVFALFVVIIGIRSSLHEHVFMKYAKYVTPDNFSEYHRNKNIELGNHQVVLPSGFQNFLVSNRVRVLTGTIATSDVEKQKFFAFCFNEYPNLALCYSKLIDHCNENQECSEFVIPLSYFLRLYDPFSIYYRENL
ncbi:O-antigen ligase family protein [Leptospira sp. 96542]|nr:O-antigen ligase family protein [Leptospira sp. 96542]